jgi:hypothetical protein
VGEVAVEVVAEVEQPAAAPPRQTIESLGRIFAMLLLPLSIAPVLLLGPSVLRAPIALFNEAWGDVQRLEGDLLPAHRVHRRVVDDARGIPTVSFGPVYGRWSVFPQQGKARPGVQKLGPEGWTR